MGLCPGPGPVLACCQGVESAALGLTNLFFVFESRFRCAPPPSPLPRIDSRLPSPLCPAHHHTLGKQYLLFSICSPHPLPLLAYFPTLKVACRDDVVTQLTGRDGLWVFALCQWDMAPHSLPAAPMFIVHNPASRHPRLLYLHTMTCACPSCPCLAAPQQALRVLLAS